LDGASCPRSARTVPTAASAKRRPPAVAATSTLFRRSGRCTCDVAHVPPVAPPGWEIFAASAAGVARNAAPGFVPPPTDASALRAAPAAAAAVPSGGRTLSTRLPV